MAAADLDASRLRRSPRASAGIFQVHVATWPAMSPLPFRRLPESRARQRDVQGRGRDGHAPERHAARAYGLPACGLATLQARAPCRRASSPLSRRLGRCRDRGADLRRDRLRPAGGGRGRAAAGPGGTTVGAGGETSGGGREAGRRRRRAAARAAAEACPAAAGAAAVRAEAAGAAEAAAAARRSSTPLREVLRPVDPVRPADRDAHADRAERGRLDVGAVAGGVEPGRHHGRRRRLAGRDVLADRPARGVAAVLQCA